MARHLAQRGDNKEMEGNKAADRVARESED